MYALFACHTLDQVMLSSACQREQRKLYRHFRTIICERSAAMHANSHTRSLALSEGDFNQPA